MRYEQTAWVQVEQLLRSHLEAALAERMDKQLKAEGEASLVSQLLKVFAGSG